MHRVKAFSRQDQRNIQDNDMICPQPGANELSMLFTFEDALADEIKIYTRPQARKNKDV